MFLILSMLSASFAATCDLFPSNTCSSSVATVSVSSTAATAKVNMQSAQRLDLFAKVCNPSGWFLHMADSPTSDGFGGDSATTDHDAEAWLAFDGATPYLGYASSYDKVRSVYPERHNIYNAINEDYADAAGCHTVRMTFINAATTSAASTVQFDSDVANAYGILPEVNLYTLWGPRLGYAAAASATGSTVGVEADYEDRRLADSAYWYVGLNRTYGSASRSGSGVVEGCIVTSTSTSTLPASCL